MKFKTSSILLTVLLLLVSCYKVEKPELPSNLLTEDEMVVILVDMAMMSSAKGVDKKKLETSGIIPSEYIFKKHAIDSVRFNQSNNYYAYDTKTYTEIYGRVKDSLTKLRDHYKEVEAKEEKQKAKQDSIKRVERKKQDSIKKQDPNYKKNKLKAAKKSTLKK